MQIVQVSNPISANLTLDAVKNEIRSAALERAAETNTLVDDTDFDTLDADSINSVTDLDEFLQNEETEI